MGKGKMPVKIMSIGTCAPHYPNTHHNTNSYYLHGYFYVFCIILHYMNRGQSQGSDQASMSC